MGWVPPSMPPKPDWMTQEHYRKTLLADYRKQLLRLEAEGRHSFSAGVGYFALFLAMLAYCVYKLLSL